MPTSSYGQVWAVDGAEWHYGYSLDIMGNLSYVTARVTGDTVVNNSVCKKIEWWLPFWSTHKSEITYEDSGVVYWFNPEIDTFTTLYDFNALPGESWQLQLDDSCVETITVDSIGTTVINGDSLKVLHISDGISGLGDGIIEKIGATLFSFPNGGDIADACYGIAVDESWMMGLRCYEDSSLGLYETGASPSCTYTFTRPIGINETESQKMSIYPNPTAGALHFNSAIPALLNVEVLDINGRRVKIFNDLQTMNLIDMNAGIYFLQVNDASGLHTMLKVIKY